METFRRDLRQAGNKMISMMNDSNYNTSGARPVYNKSIVPSQLRP